MNRKSNIFIAVVLMLVASLLFGVKLDEAKGPQTRVAIISDLGKESDNVENLIDSWNVEAIITAGDNNHESPDLYDENVYAVFRNYIDTERFYTALGNHDWGDAFTGIFYPPDSIPLLNHLPYIPREPANGRYYTVSFKYVDVFVLDSDIHEPDGRTADSKQAQWLKNGLSSSTKPFKIVVLHHPPFSSCQFQNDEEVQWPYKQWGASVVISGHCHNYERLEVDGLPYIVNGLGGATRYSYQDISPYSQNRYVLSHGAILVTATSDSLSIKFVTTFGLTIDHLIIPK